MESGYAITCVNKMFLLISELWSQGNNFPPLNKGASEYLDLYPCEQSLPVSASETGMGMSNQPDLWRSEKRGFWWLPQSGGDRGLKFHSPIHGRNFRGKGPLGQKQQLLEYTDYL